jgi:hypothetical protein
VPEPGNQGWLGSSQPASPAGAGFFHLKHHFDAIGEAEVHQPRVCDSHEDRLGRLSVQQQRPARISAGTLPQSLGFPERLVGAPGLDQHQVAPHMRIP